MVDVAVLSLLTFAANGPNLHLSLLFVITIFAASLLLDPRKALVITLIAVISVIYQHFISSLFALSSLNNIGNSVLLAIMFFVVYGCGLVAVRRFQIGNTEFPDPSAGPLTGALTALEQVEMGYLVFG